jgi:hypothetical protein
MLCRVISYKFICVSEVITAFIIRDTVVFILEAASTFEIPVSFYVAALHNITGERHRAGLRKNLKSHHVLLICSKKTDFFSGNGTTLNCFEQEK